VHFITLEGLDGSGKTTQIKRLAAWLQKRGLDPVITRQPGGTPRRPHPRSAARLRLHRRRSLTEMALMFADRAQAIAEVIQPALDAGKIVLCDRFTDSTEAYQGGGRELGSAVVLELHRLICGNLQPDLTLLLLPSLRSQPGPRPPPQPATSAQTGKDEGRFEQEKDAFYRRVWEKYREIAAREPERVVLIEGNLTIDEVHEQIVRSRRRAPRGLQTSPTVAAIAIGPLQQAGRTSPRPLARGYSGTNRSPTPICSGSP
jgi:dTMP kinase